MPPNETPSTDARAHSPHTHGQAEPPPCSAEPSGPGAPPNRQPLSPPFGLTRTVAFMNQKGGVGKTTTVVSLAAALAHAGRPTLVVDLDPQAHATLHLGVDPDGDGDGAGSGLSVYDVLHDPSAIDEAIAPARDRLDLLPALTDLAAAETELAAEPDRFERLASALDRVRERYQFILFDCPPSLGLLTLSGLAAAKEVVIPMQAHFLALQGVGKLLETVQLVGQQVNPKLRVSGVILCMHDENTRHAREVVADLEGFLRSSAESDAPWAGARLFRPAVRRNIKLAESPSFGQTVFEYARWCPGALDYQRLADGFVREWDGLLSRRASKGETVTRPARPADADRVGADAR